MIAQQQDLGPFALTLGLMIVLIMGVTVGLYIYRARMFRDDRSPGVGASSTLESLRSLRDSGRISDEEFREARDKIVARASGRDAERPKPVQTGERRAPPGYDLTGEPLPPVEHRENRHADPPDSP